MSPEVLRSQDINEKCDVYSFAIVCWEIFERKEPFENHDSYSTFVDAICNLKERPPLSDKMHPLLKQLISQCWDEDVNARPSFEKIITTLDEIAVACAIDDPDAQMLWKKVSEGKEKVPFRKFAGRLWYTLEMGPPDIDSIEYKCLEAILGQHDKREEGSM